MDARQSKDFFMTASPSSRRVRPGFTLLELLVSIGVIVLLLSMLVPSLLRVRFTQSRTLCATSMRQVGQGVWSYAINNYASMPTHYGDLAETFDTFAMSRPEDGELVNLGLVTPYIQAIEPFYCPSQDAKTSPSLACNTPENHWIDKGNTAGLGSLPSLASLASFAGPGPGRGRGGIIAQGKPPEVKPGGPPPPPPGLNSSFAARSRACADEGLPSWKTFNHANKVIYSDFVGLDNSPPRGRFKKQISAPHGGEGCNRLFGNGSVQWADMKPLNKLRPVGPAAPNARELHEYYKLLDVLP